MIVAMLGLVATKVQAKEGGASQEPLATPADDFRQIIEYEFAVE